jgi:hypothetical protein
MTTVINWLGRNPKIVAVGVVCVTVGIVAAMYFGYDMSWFHIKI